MEGRLAPLRGWKEIAAYLHASERSAKRWEATRKLPIHRIPGSVRDTVIAHAEELDAWLRGPDAVGGGADRVATVTSAPSARPAGTQKVAMIHRAAL